jgi:hypothetical protein
MFLPREVTRTQLQAAWQVGFQLNCTKLLKEPQARYCWQPIVVWSVARYLDESVMFLLATAEYERKPNHEAMMWIFEHFVGDNRKRKAQREVNISAESRDRTFELVTGAQNRSYPRGARPDAFKPALAAIMNQLADIDRRFTADLGNKASPEPAYKMNGAAAMVIDQEVTRMWQLGILF